MKFENLLLIAECYQGNRYLDSVTLKVSAENCLKSASHKTQLHWPKRCSNLSQISLKNLIGRPLLLMGKGETELDWRMPVNI